MPFELGLDFGCRTYAGTPFETKQILILEEQQYRYQAALSDPAGSDIESHGGDYEKAVRKVRNWLSGIGGFESIGAASIISEYEDFQAWHLERQMEAGFSEDDILDFPTAELLQAMLKWAERGQPRE